MRRLVVLLVLLVLLVGLVGFGTVAHAEDWPQWRGPDGRRISSESGLPTEWTASTVAWRTPLAGLGVSSPIVSGDLVILTSQIGWGPLRPGGHPTLVRGGPDPDGERPLGGERVSGGGQDVTFLITAFSRVDGSVVWEHRIAADGDVPDVHQKSNLANASPASDGERVYAWFATGQLVALDTEGVVVWERHLGRDYGPFEVVWGHSSSPLVYPAISCFCNATRSPVPICWRSIAERAPSAGRWSAVSGCGHSVHRSWLRGRMATS